MAFRTNSIKVDGSINIDGSIYQWNKLFVAGGGNVYWGSNNVGDIHELLTSGGDGSIISESTLLFSNNVLHGKDNSLPQSLSIRAGHNTSSGSGANLILSSGNATVDGSGGNLYIYSGNAVGTKRGGSLYIQSGESTADKGGSLQIISGDGPTGGGNIIILGGTGSSGSGGNIIIQAGGGNTGGDISINWGNSLFPNHGKIFIGDNLVVDNSSSNYILPSSSENYGKGIQISKAGTRGILGFYNSTTDTNSFLPWIEVIPDYNLANGRSLLLRMLEPSTSSSKSGLLVIRGINYSGSSSISNTKKILDVQNLYADVFSIFGNGDTSTAGNIFVKNMSSQSSSDIVYYQSTGQLTHSPIASYVNSSSYYDASITYRRFPEPSTGLGALDSQGMYCNFVAGATVKSGYCCYITSTGRVGLADADASSTMPCVAINTTGGALSAGYTYSLLIYGPVRYIGYSFTPGKPVYVSTTGFPTTTPPSSAPQCVQVIGYAISRNAFIFNPSPDFIVLK